MLHQSIAVIRVGVPLRCLFTPLSPRRPLGAVASRCGEQRDARQGRNQHRQPGTRRQRRPARQIRFNACPSGRLRRPRARAVDDAGSDPNYLSTGADLTALCAAVEHCRAIGLTAGLSEWRKREIEEIPSGKAGVSEYVARNISSYWHAVGILTVSCGATGH